MKPFLLLIHCEHSISQSYELYELDSPEMHQISTQLLDPCS